MSSIKAISAGVVFVLLTVFLLQIAYIFIAVGYNAMAKTYPFLNDIAGSFRYVVGIPLFSAVMFTGGCITAKIARTKIVLHCVVVGLIVAVSMFYPLLQHSNLTVIGIVVFILAIVAATGGGLYCQQGGRTERI